jgi:hypothetical protein
MNYIDEINEKVLQLWNSPCCQNVKAERLMVPMLYPALRSAELLFVGSHPSFSPENYLKQIPEPRKFYKWNSLKDTRDKKAKIIEIESKMRNGGHRSYFNTFEHITTEINKYRENHEWENNAISHEYIELFFYRKTAKEKLKNIVCTPDGALNEFGRKQVELSCRLISAMAPKIIVISDRFASDKFKELYPLEKFNGYHVTKIDNKSVPVFLAGTISFGRLDDYSLERLAWHINKACEWNKRC